MNLQFRRPTITFAFAPPQDGPRRQITEPAPWHETAIDFDREPVLVSRSTADYLGHLRSLGFSVAPFRVAGEEETPSIEIAIAEMGRKSFVDRPDEEDQLAAYLRNSWGLESVHGYEATQEDCEVNAHSQHTGDILNPIPHPEDIAPFQKGDVVQLQSGGIPMTVEDIERCAHCGQWHVDVVWTTADGDWREIFGLDYELLELAYD